MLAHCKPPCLLVLQQQVRLPHRHRWCWLSVKCWQEAQSCVCPWYSPISDTAQLHVLSQPRQETLCWREASKQQQLEEVEPFWGLAVQNFQIGCSWEMQPVQLSVTHKLPRSLPCVEQLLSLEFLFAFPGPPHQAAPRACGQPSPCAPAAEGTAASCRERDLAVPRALCLRGLVMGNMGCLCCVSACTSLQPCLELPWAHLAAFSAVKRLSCCYRIDTCPWLVEDVGA